MTMRNKNFAAFILTHGRANNVHTYDTIRKQGYTGPIWIVIDDEDATSDSYREKFGEQVISFSKSKIAETFDEADNFDDRRSIVYARNACFQIAKELGVTDFIQLDDDYMSFVYRFDRDRLYNGKMVKSLDVLFDGMVDFMKSTPVATVAFSQGGDHMGGGEAAGLRAIKMKRKAMNTFFCRTDRPFDFLGRINEDVNTYVSKGGLGEIFLSMMSVQVNQRQTQSNDGGMTDIYKISGTYVKSFYSIMFAPSCVKIGTMGRTERRLHHRIRWKNAVPMILREGHRRSAGRV